MLIENGGFCSLPLAACNLGSSLLIGRQLNFVKTPVTTSLLKPHKITHLLLGFL